MLSSHEDALKFIREFEASSREYLLSKGTSDHELASAYLELQWKFLRTIIKDQPISSHRRPANRLRSKSHSIA